MSIAVATADEVDALRVRIEQLAAELAELRTDRAGGREVYTPKQIARRFKAAQATVYAACKSGALVAQKRPHREGVAYQITLEDARRWWATVAATRSNQ